MTVAKPRYLFGDSDRAARRLEILAEVFKPTSRAFLSGCSAEHVELSYDLGCGPGFTTHLAAETLGAERTIGLDNAERFFELAQQHVSDRVWFRRQDITQTPFPDGQAGAIYGRFILAHLPNVDDLVQKWSEELHPGGRLLLEEVEWIETDIAPFRRYLDTVEAMLANNGSELYIGRALAGIRSTTLRVVRNDRIVFDVADCDAAAMFVPNLATWEKEAFVRKRMTAAEIEALRKALDERLNTTGGESNIQWRMRQIEFARS
jgi:trans-aconitate 2-methyltransferase